PPVLVARGSSQVPPVGGGSGWDGGGCGGWAGATGELDFVPPPPPQAVRAMARARVSGARRNVFITSSRFPIRCPVPARGHRGPVVVRGVQPRCAWRVG